MSSRLKAQASVEQRRLSAARRFAWAAWMAAIAGDARFDLPPRAPAWATETAACGGCPATDDCSRKVDGAESGSGSDIVDGGTGFSSGNGMGAGAADPLLCFRLSGARHFGFTLAQLRLRGVQLDAMNRELVSDANFACGTALGGAGALLAHTTLADAGGGDISSGSWNGSKSGSVASAENASAASVSADADNVPEPSAVWLVAAVLPADYAPLLPSPSDSSDEARDAMAIDGEASASENASGNESGSEWWTPAAEAAARARIERRWAALVALAEPVLEFVFKHQHHCRCPH